MVAEGLDDVLPTPFEMELLQKDVKLQRLLERISLEKLKAALDPKTKKPTDALDKLALSPIGHVLVPKREAFDFRKIAVIRPEDLIVYQAIAFMIAEPFEKFRSSIARGRIFSYRFKPELKRGQIFDPRYNIRSFQHASVNKSSLKSVKYLVKCDIANFYDRANIHRIESTLLATSGVDGKHARLANQILLHWARRDSYGLPVGSNGSRVLAEVALFNVDTALKNSGIKFLRFVDDYRIFTGSASEAHSALAMLTELLSREGLFINTQKTSIERISTSKSTKQANGRDKEVAEKLEFKEFRIRGGYAGTIPIKFRMPTKRSQKKYLQVQLNKIIRKIDKEDFASPEQIRDLLYGIITQEKYTRIVDAINTVERFPQFYPLLVDTLIKNAEHIPDRSKIDIIKQFSAKIKKPDFLSEFTAASIVQLLGSPNYFNRDTIIDLIRGMRRNAGIYYGRILFDAARHLDQRVDALEIREYFDRSNEWEKRRIIRIMSKILPEEEYNAWKRAIKFYVSRDPFAASIK